MGAIHLSRGGDGGWPLRLARWDVALARRHRESASRPVDAPRHLDGARRRAAANALQLLTGFDARRAPDRLLAALGPPAAPLGGYDALSSARSPSSSPPPRSWCWRAGRPWRSRAVCWWSPLRDRMAVGGGGRGRCRTRPRGRQSCSRNGQSTPDILHSSRRGAGGGFVPEPERRNSAGIWCSASALRSCRQRGFFWSRTVRSMDGADAVERLGCSRRCITGRARLPHRRLRSLDPFASVAVCWRLIGRAATQS